MKALSKNRIMAAMVALVVLIIALCTYSSDVGAASSTRYYWRHDYSNSSLVSYYRYSLTTSSLDNLPRTIFGDNDMVRDYDTSVVRISTGGTGFIVGNHVIATAAHCVFDQEKDEFIDITISIVDTDNTVIKTFEPQYAHVNENFATSNSYNSDYDYALIYVEEDISEYGMFNMGVALDSYVYNQGSVTVSGFPQSYPDGYEDEDWGIRFKATGNILPSSTDSQLLRYNADMTYGDSGGPAYVEESITAKNGTNHEYKTVIAINVSQTPSHNTGVRITSDLLNFYYANTYKTA